MFYLIYQSRANPLFGAIQIQEMLSKARKYNQSHEITGCLLYYDERFIQYIEGNESKIMELFERIQNDVRHSEITLLSQGKITHREFESWDMIFENLWGQGSQLQYLNLLVSSFFDNRNTALRPSPATKEFWNATKKLLECKGRLDYS